MVSWSIHDLLLKRFEKEFFMDRMLNIYVKYEAPIMPLILCKGPNK